MSESEIDRIIRTGDRADFKKYIKSCSIAELMSAHIKGMTSMVQDFGDLAHQELQNRKAIRKI